MNTNSRCARSGNRWPLGLAALALAASAVCAPAWSQPAGGPGAGPGAGPGMGHHGMGHHGMGRQGGPGGVAVYPGFVGQGEFNANNPELARSMSMRSPTTSIATMWPVVCPKARSATPNIPTQTSRSAPC